MVNSKYAMTTICNILMNLIVLETKVESTVTILESWKWVMRISSGPKNPVPQNRRKILVAIFLETARYYIFLKPFFIVSGLKLS